MSDQENIAYEYALGLLSKQEKDAIELTPEFLQAVEDAQLKLSALQLQAPLDKSASKQIWDNINQQITPEKESWQDILVARFKTWIRITSCIFSLW